MLSFSLKMTPRLLWASTQLGLRCTASSYMNMALSSYPRAQTGEGSVRGIVSAMLRQCSVLAMTKSLRITQLKSGQARHCHTSPHFLILPHLPSLSKRHAQVVHGVRVL